MNSRRVAVLGAGAWGTALADTLAHQGHAVRVWAHDPAVAVQIRQSSRNEKYLPGVDLCPRLEATEEMEEALEGAEILLSVSPSHVVRDVLTEARPHLERPTVISASKGIEIRTGLRMSEVMLDVLGGWAAQRVVVLSGPSFAFEVARHLPTAIVAASNSEVRAREVQELFQTHYLRVYTQSDVVGTELGGALKNVLALAAGMSDGLALGSNARAALVTRGLAEIARLASRLGAQEITLAGLAGIGDIVLTCTGDLSRNRTAGLAIGSGQSPDRVLAGMTSVVEGVRTARAARELARRHGVEMPIVEAVQSILDEGVDPREALATLMAREPKPERWS
ncbi:MAG: NAD(P)H-dependent glycerol-3-phosphate dehydrogenase [Gemmatimonadota bacterium]